MDPVDTCLTHYYCGLGLRISVYLFCSVVLAKASIKSQGKPFVLARDVNWLDFASILTHAPYFNPLTTVSITL